MCLVVLAWLVGAACGSSSLPDVTDVRARFDPQLEGLIERQSVLTYAGGGSAADDRLPFVRAASAIRQWRNRYVIVQDDVNVLALGSVDMPAQFDAVLLPPGPNQRRRFDDLLGNREQKLDLEGAAVLPDGRLVAFGSGTTPVRERLAIVAPDGTVTIVDGREFYAQLRAQASFAGSELNIEGAEVTAGILKLVQRGNGAAGQARPPVNAIGDVPLGAFMQWLDGAGPPPALTHVLRLDLGDVGTARLSLTDIARRADGSLVFVACAEDSPDAVRDGALLGCRVGVLDAGEARFGQITDASGGAIALKIEGIEPRRDDASRFDVVADADDPEKAAVGAVMHVTDGTRSPAL
jgi:hypothetical protein